MLIIWIPTGLIILSVGVLLLVAWRKVDYLRALDVLSIPEAKVNELKKSLVAKRLERLGAKWGAGAKMIFAPVSLLTKAGVGAVKSKVAHLEDRYQRLKKEAIDPTMTDPDTIKRMLAHAETLCKEGRYGEAEKMLIEALTHDPKNMHVYEDLARLYMLTKNDAQAEETLSFILRNNPNDASVLTSLGEIELRRDQPKAAAIYFAKAVRKRPKNPKYLDFLVEASILAGDTELARKTLAKLSLVNPENKKVGEFQTRIEEKEAVEGGKMEEKEKRREGNREE